MYSVNGSSDSISRDMNTLLYSSTFKHPADGEFAKIKQLISSDSFPNYDCQIHNQNQNQKQEDDSYGGTQSSLLHYRSTPSSFFSNLLSKNGGDEFSDPVTVIRHRQQEQLKSESDARNFVRYTPSSTAMKQEMEERDNQKPDLPPSSPAAMDGSRRVPDLSPSNNSSSYGYTNRSNLDCASSFRAMDSTRSNLVRQSSTPARLLSSLTAENGFASMKKGSSSPSSTLNNHISFSLGPSSSPSRFLPQIAENKNELLDSTFSSLKRSRDGVLKMPQNGETGNDTSNLVHHMSLPKTSSEMAVAENLLHFQQESAWKTRAKRGFATHPRSIAERVRRTRISERIKRLQELFPDMDKHSNTADMLDMAVEHIKNLQKELQTLNDARARCKCSSKQFRSV